MSLKLDGDVLVDEQQNIWSLDNQVLGLEFETKISKSSSATIIVTNAKKRVTPTYLKFATHMIGFALLGFVGLYLCEYSVILVGLASLFIFIYVFPKYVDEIDHLASCNVKSYTFEDPVDIVNLQKALMKLPRGRFLIKRGLMFGESGEKLFSVVLPSYLFDSALLRRVVKFTVDVLYPVLVVLLPLGFGMLTFASPVWKQMKLLSKKDFIVKYMLLIYKLFAGYLYFMSPYSWLLSGVTWLFEIELFEYFDLLIMWLRSEVATLMMKIDYFYAKKLKLFESLGKMKKYLGKTKLISFFIRTYAKLKKPVAVAKKRINPKLISKVSSSAGEISDKVAEVKREYELLKEDSKKDN